MLSFVSVGFICSKISVGVFALSLVLAFVAGNRMQTIGDYFFAPYTNKGNQVLSQNIDFGQVEKTYDILKTKFDGKLDSAKLQDGLQKGLVDAAGDPYTVFLSQKEAEEAKMHFITLFQKGDIPENIPTYELDQPKLLLDILVDVGLIDSKNQGRRLIEQNGIKFNGVIVADFNAEVNAKGLIQVGKRKFLRVLKG